MQEVGKASAKASQLKHGLLQYSVVDFDQSRHKIVDKLFVNVKHQSIIGLKQTAQKTFVITLILLR